MDRNDIKILYCFVRQLTVAHGIVSIKDKNGKILVSKEEQNMQWVEYFKEMLNQRRLAAI